MIDIQFDLPKDKSSIIKVIGVGGGGGNAVNHMFEQGIAGVNFVICNTDAQALDLSPIPVKVQLGPSLTQGLGAGSNPEIGSLAAEESVQEIKELLSKNTKMVFITAGMGGGTGTGAAHVIARIAKELGILTVGIVTTPFSFEGKRKYNQALEGIEKLKNTVDTILIISNDKIREMFGDAKHREAFNHANNILTTAAKSISEIITISGYINVDFADVKHVMTNGGTAVMGSASAEGTDRAMNAVKGALNSPLLNDNDIRGAKKILLNITSGTNQATIDEITLINEYVQEVALDTDIIFGACDDESLGDKLTVTIIATGFESNNKPAFTTVSNKTVYTLNESSMMKEKAVKEAEQKTAQASLFKIEESSEIKDEIIIEKPIVAESVQSECDMDLFTMSALEEATAEDSVTVEFDFEQPKLATEGLIETENDFTHEAVENFQQHLSAESISSEEEESVMKFSVRSYETNEQVSVQTTDLEKQLSDRKRILQQISFRSLNKQMVNEMEKVPAYLRKDGVEIENKLYSEVNNSSRYSISEDEINQRPEVKKNNTFLHDNVD